MSLWEPFTGPARRAVVRAHQVAQMFGSPHIGVEHVAFALAEGDDAVANVLATAIDRDAIRERLGIAGAMPKPDMVFTKGAKRTIELAFENARRLGHDFIGVPHLALGLLGNDECPPLVAGADPAALRTSLETIAGEKEA